MRARPRCYSQRRPRVPGCLAMQHIARTFITLLVMFCVTGCAPEQPGEKSGEQGRGGDQARPAPVVLATAELRGWQQSIEGIANLRAQESVLLTAPVSGRIAAVLFREGAPVAAGAPLVRLEDDEEKAEFDAAQVNTELQQTRLTRMQTLRGQGLLSQDEIDTQTQALREAQARLALARARLDHRTVRAPFAGVLGFRTISPGALVQPGDAIVSLDAIDTLRAEFQVTETQIAGITAGMTVAARSAAYPDRVFKGTVTMIGSRVDEATRTVPVQARINNRDLALKPGMLLTVRAQAREHRALFVPEAAVVPEGTRQYLWRITPTNNTVERITVGLGARQPGFVEITAGLNAGDRVVQEGQNNLHDGQVVLDVNAPAVKTHNQRAP